VSFTTTPSILTTRHTHTAPRQCNNMQQALAASTRSVLLRPCCKHAARSSWCRPGQQLQAPMRRTRCTSVSASAPVTSPAANAK
jgi:hypothetical protein